MPKWRLKTDWLPIPKDITIGAAEIGEAAEKKETGAGVAKALAYGMGMIPFSLIPILDDIYRAGASQIVKMAQQELFETFRFTPQEVAQLQLREYIGMENKDKWLQDLRDQGWSEERIKLLKELMWLVPPAQDIIRFAVREAYTPEIAEKYGQYQDFPDKAMVDAKQAGIGLPLMQKYWAAHWSLPGADQGFEMFHRGQITFDELKTLLRALDIMPYWRDKLINIAYNVLTRVDARRMWDMRVIDDARLLKVYKDEGYEDKDAKDLTTWTKVYQTFPDLIARYKNAWINSEQVIAELIKLGLTPEYAQELFEQKIKNPTSNERVAPERDLTAAEIYKGVKQEIISWETGSEYLQYLGWDADEAEYKLEINIAAAGSPETPLDYAILVNAYRKSQGLPYKEVPEDLLFAEKAYFSTKEALRIAKVESIDLDKLQTLEAEVYKLDAILSVLKKQYDF